MTHVGSTAAATPWLRSPRFDLAMFGLGPVLALMLAALVPLGFVEPGDTPEWAWLITVLGVDVAHVWATAILAFDRPERTRHGALWLAVIGVSYAVCALLYSLGPFMFWRAIAYAATFHFVRQQWGWVALYRRRDSDASLIGAVIDRGAIYAATLFPLVYWHSHSRNFAWMTAGDFVSLPGELSDALFPVYVLTLGAYLARMGWRWRRGDPQPGKDLVVISTATLWAIGIMVWNGDFTFTVTNVLPHGIPYLFLIGLVARSARLPWFRASLGAGLLMLLGFVWCAALIEEVAWDLLLWRERPWLSALHDIPSWDRARAWCVPLLATPQVAHYLLDGVIWRRTHRPDWLAQAFPSNPATASPPSRTRGAHAKQRAAVP